MFPPSLYFKVLGDSVKNGGPSDCSTQQFLRGIFGIKMIKVRHLKGETNGEVLEESIQMELSWKLELKATN